MEVSNIEYIVIFAYLILIIVVGLVFKKFSSNTDDYFKGGSKGTWWLVGSSAFMSAFSAWTFTGAAGIAYESGFSAMFIFFGNVLGFFVNYLFMGPWLRQMRVTTFPEAIAARFGNGTRDFYAYYEVPVRILYSAMALYGLGIFCSAVFGYDINHVIVVCGIVVLFYSATGGRWAVMATDFLQGLILVPLTLIVAYLCLDALGGIDNLFLKIEEQGLTEEYSMVNSATLFGGAYTWGWASAMMVKQFIVFNSMNAAPRYFSVKDGKEAKKAALLCAVLMLFGSFIWFLPPITARLLYPELVIAFDIAKPAEASYAVASIALLPVGLVGLIVVAILAATMSSMDTGLNTNVAILIKDIYPKIARKLRWKTKSESQLLSHGRTLTWAMGTIVVILALYFAQQDGSGIFEIMLQVGTLLSTPITIPLLLGMFIRQTPWWSALLSIGCALSFSALAYFEVPLVYLGFSQAYSDAFEWSFQQQFFGVMATGTFGFLISIPFAPAKTSEHRVKVDRFFKNMKTPIDFANEVGEGNDDQQLTIIGRFGAAVTAFVALLLIIPNPLEGRLAILALAIMIGTISILMLKAGNKAKATPIT
ncbi:sodium:solute symporter family transporter [Pseudocolwellia sp. HL-MZ19]|uniref:sodium:solute symporter family transporter n=1 Tax=unclassified Pseudocolwellia TaxID=2848178 RepID=UPI003CE81176